MQGRCCFIVDLPAADGRYHQQCAVAFKAGRGKPKRYDTDQTPYPERKRRHTTGSEPSSHIRKEPDFSRLAAFLDTVNEFENSESGVEKMEVLILIIVSDKK